MELVDVKNPYELYDFMKNRIKYGFISSKDNKVYIRKLLKNDKLYDETIVESYFLQTPNELLTNNCGLCWDQVEFERTWFLNNGYEVYTFFTTFHNHSFLIFSKNNTYCLFERTLPQDNGIYEAESLEDCLKIYIDLQKKNLQEDIDKIEIYPYVNPPFHTGFRDFISYAKLRYKEKKSFNINKKRLVI